MMGDNRPLEDLRPMEFLNVHLEDNLQPCPGTRPNEIRDHPGPSEPCQEHTWPFDPPESSRTDAHHGSSGVETARLGSCSFEGETRQTPASLCSVGDNCPLGSPQQQNPSSSTQVVFWAGILQAQMCVLDLEEELEKTEGLKAELRCCIPPPTKDFLSDVGLSPSLPKEEDEDPGDDSSEPEEEKQAWPREQMSGSSPEWGAEEDSIFFDNPLFLESPDSDTSTEGECFSWGCPDSHPDMKPHSPQALHSSLQEGTGLSGSELDLGSHTADHRECVTPPFSVPSYKLHPCLALRSTEGAPTVPPDQEGETPQSLSDLAPPILEDHSRPQEPLISQNGGEKDAGCFQEPMLCTLAPWGSQASSLEPSGPSPVASQEGSPQIELHSPKWPQDASFPLLLEKDESDLSSLKIEETEEAPNLRQEAECEDDTARTEEASAARYHGRLTSAEGLPRSPIAQAQFPEEGWRPSSRDKLANNNRSDKGAWDLALRLYHLDGFRKSEVASHLRKNNDFSRAVAEAYLSFFQFEGQSLDRALRGFLQALVLSGETQERERILYQFSKRFHYCNPGAFPSVDSIHTLTCAIMLLNTDLHGQNIGKSMSCQEFITNLHGLQDGRNFPKELLKALYWSIRSEKLEWAVDEEDAASPEKDQPSPSAGKISSPFLQMAQDPTVPTYKQGILARKMHHDADGKKTPWGKRGWKMFHTLLKGMVLYFLKGEGPWLDGQSLVGHLVDEPVGVHHSLASPASHYTKKPHVFQLRTADWRLYLFQAPTAKEMASWIARINLAAATHSAPPFPAAVGSQRRFVRPILPMNPAQSSLEEQHRSHENCLDAASDDLLDLQRNLPERRGRSRELEEYRLRKEFLEHEKTRYETYVQLLVSRLRSPLGDLALWEDQLGREAEGTPEPKPSLKKSHSSPSLHQDEAPTTAKVKRNISERRTYRKIIPKRNRNQL
ncbi:PH and SEC7 domain-containing protein 4 isoform X2 [Mesocricetus auratus]|uniref:PH and SEC7 domain-containing protein 4 isoform X2 n=1 Tax=Mesocricetus auratus TaxID=10036 RepID=A0ABM2XI61_MESAU|nr:PH and SEC7 domain-containing protein 4 isoform X2 [Mesocricetus auratus]